MTKNNPSNLHATGAEKLKAHLAMVLFAFLIAGSFSIGHLAAPHIDPIALNAARFTLAATVIGVVGLFVYKRSPLVTDAPWRFALLGVLTTIFFVTMFIALNITTPISTSAIFTLIPFMSAGFGWLFLRQSTAPIVLLSLAVAASGAIWVIFRGNIQAIMNFQIGNGELIFFVGAIAYAAYAPLANKYSKGEPLLHFTFTVLFATTVWLVILGNSILWETDWLAMPVIVWIAITFLAIFSTAITFFLLQFATIRLPASKVYSYGYLTPSIVILYEGLLGHGWASPVILFGAIVTALGLLVMVVTPDS